MQEFKINSKQLPKNFPREFDAHIYFSTEHRNDAEKLRNKMREHFLTKTFFVGDLIPIPIGPHPMPMFEANFPTEIFAEVVIWLMQNRGSLTVLVHPLTGDDYVDHTDAVMWLGNSMELNISKL